MERKLAILTSGGDSPGMNAAVWAAQRSARSRGMQLVGICCGYQGLIDGVTQDLNDLEATVMNQGGTFLKTARCKAMLTEEGRNQAVQSAIALGVEGLIVVGGDGSYKGARVLCERGIPTVALPGTIDNDLSYTQYSLGFDTVCNTVINAIANIMDTMTSHDRVGIVEVMGRHCGQIAMHAGLACGADYVLVPEVEYPEDFDAKAIAARIQLKLKGKRGPVLIVMAEGVKPKKRTRAHELRCQLEQLLGFTVRETVLGYMQRGGRPTQFDRRIAIEMADHAVGLLSVGTCGKAVGIRDDKIFDMDIMEALKVPKVFDSRLYDLAHRLATPL